MGESIKQNGTQYESSAENLGQELLRVKRQIQQELSSLQKDVEEDQIKSSFFEKKEDNKVVYDMDLVKKYLQSCIENENFQTNSAVIMAVQIALESKGYDVGKIDGVLTTKNSGNISNTQKAIRLFQKDNGMRIDGFPGKKTIQKILDILGNDNQTEQGENSNENTTTEEEAPVDNTQTENPGGTGQGTEKKENTRNIKITLDKNGNVKNLQEILNAKNLELPKLKAGDVSEVGGFGNTTMSEFQSYGDNFDQKFRHIVSGPWNTGNHPRAFKTPEDVIRYKENNPKIKSFIIYFGGESSNKDKTFTDISNWAEWLKNNGIEPVLCTCVGEGLDSLNNNIRQLYENNKDAGYQLIDFAKINNLTEIKSEQGNKSKIQRFEEALQSSKYTKSYALMHDMMYKCIEN